MVYHGVLHGPRRRLNHRGLRRGHQQAALGGSSAGGLQFQYQPGRTGGPVAGQGDCSGPSGVMPGGHERPLLPMAQAVVEGWPHMFHAPGRLVGLLPDQLHPGHRQFSVTERSDPERATQHRPLLGIGVPPWSRACHSCVLPREAYTLPYMASGAPGKDRPHVFQALGSHPQAPLAGVPPSDMDLI